MTTDQTGLLSPPANEPDLPALSKGHEANASVTHRVNQANPANRPAGLWIIRHLRSGLVIRLLIISLALTILLVFAFDWTGWVGAAADQTTDDAYIESDLTPLSAQISGGISRVEVSDYQHVSAGDVLVEIDDRPYRALVAEAEANVAAAEAAIQNNQSQQIVQSANIRAAAASLQGSESDLLRYQRDAVRQRRLLPGGATTQQNVDIANDAESHTAAMVAQDQAQADAAREQLEVLVTQAKQLAAALDLQRAALQVAQINLGYTHITAPVDGMVGQRQVQLGQYVSAGSQIISVIPLPNVWVIANYKETQMTRVRVGQAADVSVDSFPGVALHGHVEGWAPGSGAEFSLLPPDNATGNFTKVVQRISVKIMLDRSSDVFDFLRPGMSVVATIHTQSADPHQQ